jgi:hypothetical protein
MDSYSSIQIFAKKRKKSFFTTAAEDNYKSFRKISFFYLQRIISKKASDIYPSRQPNRNYLADGVF